MFSPSFDYLNSIRYLSLFSVDSEILHVEVICECYTIPQIFTALVQLHRNRPERHFAKLLYQIDAYRRKKLRRSAIILD